MESKSLIVLTCNVTPNKNARIKRVSTEERLQDYCTSIQKWVRFINRSGEFELLVLENSGSIESIKERVNVRNFTNTYFVAAPEDVTSHTFGISSGEFKMLQWLSLNWDLDSYQFVWKVTGRTYIYNAKKVLKAKNRSIDVRVDRTFVPGHFINSRIFGMRPEVLRKFLQCQPVFTLERSKNEIKNYTFESFEYLLTAFCLESEMNGAHVESFERVPIYSGSSGTLNKKINNLRRIASIVITNPLRRVATKLLVGSSP